MLATEARSDFVEVRLESSEAEKLVFGDRVPKCATLSSPLFAALRTPRGPGLYSARVSVTSKLYLSQAADRVLGNCARSNRRRKPLGVADERRNRACQEVPDDDASL